MADEWPRTTIGELVGIGEAHLQTGPFGTALKAAEYSQTGVPLISVGEVREGYFHVTATTPRVSAETTGRLPKFLLRRGDIVFGRKGSIDRNAMVGVNEDGWFLGSDGIRLRLDPKHDCRFFSYQMRNPSTRAWLLQNGEGSTMPSLNQGILERLPVTLPPLPEQKRIAHILGTLDDKIELNRRMNATLEAMSRAIFKSWFVDFDPVRQKAAGKQPVGMDAQTAALFPDSFEDSEIGEVPKGWRVQPISELAEIAGGSTPSTKEPHFWEGGVHCWATPKDLSNLSVPVLLDTERRLTVRGVGQITSGLLPIGTVLLSSRAPIGYLAVAETPVAINQGFIAMKPADGVSNLFLLRWTAACHDEIVSRANGSTFLEISKSNFRPIPTVRPTQTVMDAFHERAYPLFRRVVACERESRTLAALRDALLPKLLSGEVRVPEAEEAVEEVLR